LLSSCPAGWGPCHQASRASKVGQRRGPFSLGALCAWPRGCRDAAAPRLSLADHDCAPANFGRERGRLPVREVGGSDRPVMAAEGGGRLAVLAPQPRRAVPTGGGQALPVRAEADVTDRAPVAAECGERLAVLVPEPDRLVQAGGGQALPVRAEAD